MNTLSRIWKWLLDEQNRGALGTIGAAIAVVIGAGWAWYKWFRRERKETPGKAVAVPSADQIRTIIEPLHATIKDKDALIERLSSELNVSKGAFRTFFYSLGHEAVSEDRWPKMLAEIVEDHHSLLARLDALPKAKDDAEVEEKLREARAAIEAGEPTRAEALLTECEELDLQAAGEASAKSGIRRRRAAESRAARGELSLTQIDYRAAADHFRNAAELADGLDADLQCRFVHMTAEALYRQGEEKGDNAALTASIGAWRDTLERRPRERVPLDWAMTQNNLGNALTRLGERESGTVQAHRGSGH